MKRRQFLQRSLGTGSALLAVRLPCSSRPTPARPFAIDAVLLDERYGDSHEFAAVLRAAGATCMGREQLVSEWQARGSGVPRRIAGLTPHSDLFACAALGRELDLQLRFQGRHDARGGEHLAHALHLDATLSGVARRLSRAGQSWPAHLARELIAAQFHALPTLQEKLRSQAARRADFPGSLYSWVLA